MELDLREKDGISILCFSGQLTAGDGDEEFREAIDTLLASQRTRILIDFSELVFMDSSGLGELVASLRTVKRFGGELKILNPNEKIHSTLSIAKLLPIFEIYDDEPTAIASFTN